MTPPLNRALLTAELIRDEGLRTRVYHDTLGLLSIGVGRNLDRGDGGISPAETKQCGVTRQSCIANGISRDQALVLLSNDIDAVMAQLDHALPWWRGLDPVRQRVMVNLGFMGLGDAHHGLLSFTNTLAAIKAGHWDVAADGLLSSVYATEVHDRATRLAAMLRTGKAQ